MQKHPEKNKDSKLMAATPSSAHSQEDDSERQLDDAQENRESSASETEQHSFGEPEEIPHQEDPSIPNYQARTSDELRSYLREIGERPLLRREEEIELAQQMEEGEHIIMSSLLRSPWVTQELVRLGEKLQQNELSLRKMLRYPDENPENPQDASSREWLIRVLRELELAARDEPTLKKNTSPSPRWKEAKEAVCSIRWHEELFNHLIQQFHTIHENIHQLEFKLHHYAREMGVDDVTWHAYVEKGVFSQIEPHTLSQSPWLGVSQKKWKPFVPHLTPILVDLRQIETEFQQSVPELKQIHQEILRGQRQVQQAKDRMVRANLRLVVAIAKKYTRYGVSLLDLIQEGNLGLMKAVDRFDHHMGFKFATYASWWIRQAIIRTIAEQKHTVRIPTHMVDLSRRLQKARQLWIQKHGREPSLAELARELHVTVDKIHDIMESVKIPLSLDASVGDAENNQHLRDTLEDTSAVSPLDVALQLSLVEQLKEVLDTLDAREELVLRLRFGLGEDTDEHSLDEVGKMLHLSRERVRQIETRALRKLRHSSRANRLWPFLERLDSQLI